MNRTAVSTGPTALDRLQDAMAGAGPLAPLDPVDYATGHALFEARSDQRSRLSRWLVRRVAARSARPTRVLSVGCGDGSVDVRLACVLAARGRRVDYVGVEPHRPSAHRFAARLDAVGGVTASVSVAPFVDARPTGVFDVVVAVHSLYYVDDLVGTLERACAVLADGGEFIVLHAPLEPVNSLVRLLAPGRRQAFSDEVVAELAALGRRADVTRIDNRLDLTASGDADTDRRLVDFTVQATVPTALRPTVRAALAERAEPGSGLVLSHPVDAIVVRA